MESRPGSIPDVASVRGKIGRGHQRLVRAGHDGNVWYLGEDTKEYEDGKVSSTEGIMGGRRRWRPCRAS